MKALVLDGRDGEVVEALAAIAGRLPAKITMVTVARANGEDLAPDQLVAIQEQGATDDAVCVLCRSKCWWTAASRSMPGPLAPVCTRCIAAELKSQRAARGAR